MPNFTAAPRRCEKSGKLTDIVRKEDQREPVHVAKVILAGRRESVRVAKVTAEGQREPVHFAKVVPVLHHS